MQTSIERSTLGSFMHVTCFLYLVQSAEELAGSALIVNAGKQRGSDIINAQGLAGKEAEPNALQQALDDILGEHGTRLCLIKNISSQGDGSYTIELIECVHSGYAMGVFIGALGTMTGKTMLGQDLTITNEATGTCNFSVVPF